jgi:hypothetical protein
MATQYEAATTPMLLFCSAASHMKTLRSSLLFLGAALALLVPPTASAHVLQPVGTTVVQDVGPYQLAATMTVPNTLPAPLSVQIAAEQSFSAVVAITLWLVPAGGSLPTPPPAHVISAQGPSSFNSQSTIPGIMSSRCRSQVNSVVERLVCRSPLPNHRSRGSWQSYPRHWVCLCSSSAERWCCG